MLIQTDARIFSTSDSLQSVLQIFKFLAEGRHDWAPTDRDVRAVEETFALQVPPLADTLVDVTQKAWIKRTAWTPPREPVEALYIDLTNVVEAAEDLARPGIVVVEDIETDGAFIRVVLSVAAEQHTKECVARGWIELRHAGGSGRVRDVALAERDKFNLRPRVCAIVDSDKLYPDERTHAHTLAEQLLSEGIPAHVLSFREIENYLPNRALSSIKPFRDVGKKIDALKKLSKSQRAHFDMKKGFGAGAVPGGTAPRHNDTLYLDVPARVMDLLLHGFGAKVILCVHNVLASLTIEDMNALGEEVPGELREVARLISETCLGKEDRDTG